MFLLDEARARRRAVQRTSFFTCSNNGFRSKRVYCVSPLTALIDARRQRCGWVSLFWFCAAPRRAAAEGDKPEGLQPDNMEMHERARLPQVVMRNSRR
jgi:hypothetical protein